MHRTVGLAQGPSQHMASEGERGRVGEGVYSKSCCSLVSPVSSTHTHTHILQTGPPRELDPLVAHVEPFSVPLCPSQWQRYFGVFVSPSPDLL